MTPHPIQRWLRVPLRHPRIALACLLGALAAGATTAYFQLTSAPPPSLATFAPAGALLAIESPDFAALLHAWTGSSEQKRWLTGDDYAAFSRSRLFGRLGQAQSEFTATAGLAPDAGFLTQIAGNQSLLAWYDIGNLQFLYITRLPSAANTPLLALRTRFEQRTSGDSTFYVRTQQDPDSGQTRTVAFAVRGDYLLLATREDLLAGALALMQHPANRTLATDAFYSNATAVASSTSPPDLRMTLNLAAIVRSPYFRTYWVQQNITQMKQYTAALSDLYRTSDSLREERVLIPADPEAQPTPTDLASLLSYLPPNSGVYRAVADPSSADVLAQLEDKLLSRAPGGDHDSHTAPTADLSTPTTGDATNASFEQRIDDPPLLTPSSSSADLAPLRALLLASPPQAMLTYATATSPTANPADAVFLPFHTAVLLQTTSTWAPATLQQTLRAVLTPRLSTSGLGLTWKETPSPTGTTYQLTGPHPLAFALRGRICLFASDPATLAQLLAAPHATAPSPRIATTIAGVSARSERPAFTRLTQRLDHTAAPAPQAVLTPPTPAGPPPFFSGNIASLTAAFQDLDSETFTETTTPTRITHQTVLYQWRR